VLKLCRSGAHADIVVFDAEQISSRFTVKEPRRYATGIAHVLVNGKSVIQEGVRTGENPGCVLRGGV